MTWDICGHDHFNHYNDYDRTLDEALGDQWLFRERYSAAWIKKRYPCPLQLNLGHLSKELAEQAVSGLEKISTGETPDRRNFRSGFHPTLVRPWEGSYSFQVIRGGRHWLGPKQYFGVPLKVGSAQNGRQSLRS